MATNYTRRITLYLNEKEATNDIKSIRTAYMKANSELNKMTMGTKEWVAQMQKVKGLKGILEEHNAALRNTAKQGFSFSKLSDGFNKYFGIITAGAASLTGLVLAGRKAVDTFNEFEKKVDELSALTGLMGDDLQWLSEQAKQMGTSVDESGIRITKSANDVLEAYKLMGSAKPELLGNKEALHEVTKQALILAEASQMETGPAVEALASIMNQFGAPADQAGKFINILAAGSKEGAAEVGDLADSIIRSGAAANQAGVSIEQEVALIEALAEKGVKAEKAGTGLKTFLLKLQTGADDTNPAIVGMSKALENLEAKNLSAAEMTDIFGTETYTVASLLINSRQRFDELSEAVTGTNTAYEQAAINTDNNATKLAQAQNRAELMRIELGEKLAPAMTYAVSTGTMFMKVLSAMVELFSKHGSEILLVAGAIAAYTIALQINTAESKANALWTKVAAGAQSVWSTVIGLVTGKIKIATIAQKVWNAVILMNPIGAIIAGVALLAAGIVLLVKSMNSQTAAQKAVNDVTKQAKKDIIEQKLKTEDLLAVAKDENRSMEERKAALAELNKMSPEYFGNLSIEKSTTEELTKAGEAYIANLEKQALVKAAQAKIDELRNENAEKEIDIQTKSKKWWESEEGHARRATKAINENKEQIEALQGVIDKSTDKAVVNTVTNKTVSDIEDNPDALGGNKKKDEENKKALEKLKLQQDKEIVELKKSLMAKGLLSEEMNAVIEQKEMEHLVAMLAMKKKAGEDTTDIEGQIVDKQIKIAENYQKQKADIDKAMAELEKEYKKDFEDFDKEAEDEQNSENEKELEEAQKQFERYNELKEKYQSDEKKAQEELNEDLAGLEEARRLGLLDSHEEYEKKKTEITKKHALERFKKEQEYLEGAGKIVNILSDLNNAAKDFELKKAGDNAKKKEEIERKYAKRSQAISIAQAAINGALAVTKILAETPKGDFGVMTAILIGAAIATTAAEIATIANQQFKTGGYTESAASDSKPVGVVHANEWVASAPLLRNPETRRHIDYLEARQRGLVPTFDTGNMTRSMRGFQSGGFTGNNTSVINNNYSNATDPAMMEILALLARSANKLADKPLTVNANEVFKEKEKYDNSIRASEY